MTASSEAKTAVNPTHIGWLFVQQYYTFLNESPEKLHLFYNKNSCFIHGREGQDIPVVHGQKDINATIANMDFVNCKVFISNVDSQASMSGGVIVQVLGEMSNNGSICRKFAQTFFLAEQPEGYYVLNDIFRFLKEDIDNDYDFEGEEAAEATPFHFQDATVPASVTVAPAAGPDVVAEPEQKTEEEKKPAPVVEKIQTDLPAAPVNGQKQASPTKKEARTPKEGEERSKSPTKRQSTSAAPASWSKIVSTDPKPMSAPAAVKSVVAAANDQPKVVKKEEDESMDGFKEITRARPNKTSPMEDKEKYTIYLKSIPENTDRRALTALFETEVGPVLNIDIPTGKRIAFVTFKSQESVAKAINKTLMFNGETLTPEERRKQARPGEKKVEYYNNRGGAGFKSTRGGANGGNKFNQTKGKPTEKTV